MSLLTGFGYASLILILESKTLVDVLFLVGVIVLEANNKTELEGVREFEGNIKGVEVADGLIIGVLVGVEDTFNIGLADGNCI